MDSAAWNSRRAMLSAKIADGPVTSAHITDGSVAVCLHASKGQWITGKNVHNIGVYAENAVLVQERLFTFCSSHIWITLLQGATAVLPILRLV